MSEVRVVHFDGHMTLTLLSLEVIIIFFYFLHIRYLPSESKVKSAHQLHVINKPHRA